MILTLHYGKCKMKSKNRCALHRWKGKCFFKALQLGDRTFCCYLEVDNAFTNLQFTHRKPTVNACCAGITFKEVYSMNKMTKGFAFKWKWGGKSQINTLALIKNNRKRKAKTHCLCQSYWLSVRRSHYDVSGGVSHTVSALFRPLFLYSFACKWTNHLFHYLSHSCLSLICFWIYSTLCANVMALSFFLNIYNIRVETEN